MESLLIHMYLCGFSAFFGLTIGASDNTSPGRDLFTGLVTGLIWPFLAVMAVFLAARRK